MKFYSVVGFIVVLGLTLSFVYGKHKREHASRHQHHKHSRFVNLRHLTRFKNSRKLSHHSHPHLQGRHHTPRPGGLKCRRAKFIINRHIGKEDSEAAKRHLNKKHAEALKRHLNRKHAKLVLHKLATTNKRFRLPKETKLFEDKEGRLVTYMEDCVTSEHADKKDSFGGQTEVVIAPDFGKSKKHHHHQEHSSKDDSVNTADSHDNAVNTVDSHDNAISEEGILPASEDSLLQTVSDSTQILKDDAQKEGTAQFMNDQHDTDIPSNFATVFQAATLDNPLPKKPEEGSEMQKFFSTTGLGNVGSVQLPPLPDSNEDHSTTNGDLQSGMESEGNVVTPISEQPVNIPERSHNNQMSYTPPEVLSNPGLQREPAEVQALQNAGITQSMGSEGLRNAEMTQSLASQVSGLQTAGITTSMGNQGLQNAGITTSMGTQSLGNPGNPDVTSQLLRNPGNAEYTSPLRNQEVTHARFADNPIGETNRVRFSDNLLGEPADSFSDAFAKLKSPEAQELASIVNNGPVPQTLEGAMKEDNEEAFYENKFEKVYGKDDSVGLQKGAAYLPQRQNH